MTKKPQDTNAAQRLLHERITTLSQETIQTITNPPPTPTRKEVVNHAFATISFTTQEQEDAIGSWSHNADKRRTADIVSVRMLITLMLRLRGWSSVQIAEELKLDGSTVRYYLMNIRSLLERDNTNNTDENILALRDALDTQERVMQWGRKRR
jgi:DNA-binding NarL/FixJ family response regulator